jgi:hypothetical protein
MSQFESSECKAGITPHGMLCVSVAGREFHLFFTDWWKLADTGIVERVQNKAPSDPITLTAEEVDLLEQACYDPNPDVRLREFEKRAMRPSIPNDSPVRWRSWGLDRERKLVKIFIVTETSRDVVHAVSVYQSSFRLPVFNMWVREPFGRDMIVGDVGMVVRMDGKLFLHYHHGSLVPVTTDDPDFQ